MTPQGFGYRCPTRYIPQDDTAIITPTGQGLPVGTERNTAYGRAVSVQKSTKSRGQGLQGYQEGFSVGSRRTHADSLTYQQQSTITSAESTRTRAIHDVVTKNDQASRYGTVAVCQQENAQQ